VKGTRQVSYVFRRSATLFKFKCFRFIPGGSGTYTKSSLELNSTHVVRQPVTNWCVHGINFSSRVAYWLYLFPPRAKGINISLQWWNRKPAQKPYMSQAKSISVNGPLTRLVPFHPSGQINYVENIANTLDDGKVFNPSYRSLLSLRKYSWYLFLTEHREHTVIRMKLYKWKILIAHRELNFNLLLLTNSATTFSFKGVSILYLLGLSCSTELRQMV